MRCGSPTARCHFVRSICSVRLAMRTVLSWFTTRSCTLQIERTKWRNTLAKCHVLVCEHLDGTWSVFYGPHRVGRYAQDGSRYRSAESTLPERGNPAPPAGFPLSTATPAEERPDTRTGQITC